MQRVWGRKIGDLAFDSFLEILQTVAATKGKSVAFVGQWFASSKLCSSCGYKHFSLQLRDRHWIFEGNDIINGGGGSDRLYVVVDNDYKGYSGLRINLRQ